MLLLLFPFLRFFSVRMLHHTRVHRATFTTFNARRRYNCSLYCEIQLGYAISSTSKILRIDLTHPVPQRMCNFIYVILIIWLQIVAAMQKSEAESQNMWLWFRIRFSVHSHRAPRRRRFEECRLVWRKTNVSAIYGWFSIKLPNSSAVLTRAANTKHTLVQQFLETFLQLVFLFSWEKCLFGTHDTIAFGC